MVKAAGDRAVGEARADGVEVRSGQVNPRPEVCQSQRCCKLKLPLLLLLQIVGCPRLLMRPRRMLQINIAANEAAECQCREGEDP